MDRNSPPFYVETTSDAIADAEAFAAEILSLTETGKQQLSAAAASTQAEDVTSAAFPMLNKPTTPKVLPSITPR